jgi:hypothetical protein
VIMGLAFVVNGWLNRYDPPPPRRRAEGDRFEPPRAS